MAQSGFYVFSTWIVFSIFLSFLLPMWSLSFATETIGGEREAGTLVWLLSPAAAPVRRFTWPSSSRCCPGAWA